MARPRSEIKQLAVLLASSRNPIYAVNDRRQIVYCNAACEEWLAADREQLLGLQCDYHSGDTGEPLAAALCPPPVAFSGEPATGQLIWQRDDAATRRAVRFSPLGQGESCVGVLAVVDADEADAGAAAIPDTATSSDLHLQLQDLVRQHRGRYRLDGLVGKSPMMKRVREQVRVATETTAAVLIRGPEGSGREHLGRTIHAARGASDPGLLLPLSCELLDAEMLQATLLEFLNHCRDSVAATTGTVLLLECDRLTSEAQLELLGFLNLPTVDLCTVATSSDSLLELASTERFNHELALLLAALTIELPPLADRREDIPLFAQRILERCNARGGKQVGGFTRSVLNQLGAMPWKRNLAELTEFVEEAFQLAEGPWVQEADLPPRAELLSAAAAHPSPVEEELELDAFLADVERELIHRALSRASGNKAKAARLLGIQRARLLRRLTQLGIEHRS